MTIQSKFKSLSQNGEKALVCFFTAGDQPLEDLPEIVSLLASSGADVIEIGIPFSDPFGEGPTIQDSSQRALENGATLGKILDAIALCKVEIPLVTMGYYNPVLRFGLEAFVKRCIEVGSTGTIVSDLVPDEATAWDSACSTGGLETIYLVAPTSTDVRINQVARQSTGFVYVSHGCYWRRIGSTDRNQRPCSECEESHRQACLRWIWNINSRPRKVGVRGS
jgi:tryptophan synthase alpha chain